MHSRPVDGTQDNRFLGPLGGRVVWIAGLVGVVGLVASFAIAWLTGDRELDRLWWSYLHNWTFFLTLSLGALFFVILEHLAKAGWSVVLRRVSEGLAMGLIVLAILFIPLAFGLHDLYHWSHADAVASDHVLQHKAPYLNQGFFLGRIAFYFVVWIGSAVFLFRSSTRQDETGDHALTMRMERLSGPLMLLYALTVTFAAFDLLMSLDPHWFSTIFGIYFFAGAFLSFLALLAIVVFLLQRSGRLATTISREHYHDVGKFLFAMLVFWAYVAFSQFMLIWYGNLPEETGWYLRRQTGTWSTIAIVIVLAHFFIPFLFLLSRHVKRRPLALVIGAVWLLGMHWLDLYWLVMPEYDHAATAIPFSVLDVTCLVGVGGLFMAGCAKFLGRCSLIAAKDPRLPESLNFENA